MLGRRTIRQPSCSLVEEQKRPFEYGTFFLLLQLTNVLIIVVRVDCVRSMFMSLQTMTTIAFSVALLSADDHVRKVVLRRQRRRVVLRRGRRRHRIRRSSQQGDAHSCPSAYEHDATTFSPTTTTPHSAAVCGTLYVHRKQQRRLHRASLPLLSRAHGVAWMPFRACHARHSTSNDIMAPNSQACAQRLRH